MWKAVHMMLLGLPQGSRGVEGDCHVSGQPVKSEWLPQTTFRNDSCSVKQGCASHRPMTCKQNWLMQYLVSEFLEQVLLLQFKALQVLGKAGIAFSRLNNLST